MIAGRDAELAKELEADDDMMDTLHRRLFHVLLERPWSHGMEAAIDITLCGRYYERYADHAVSVAHRVDLPRHRRTPRLTAHPGTPHKIVSVQAHVPTRPCTDTILAVWWETGYLRPWLATAAAATAAASGSR